MLGPFETTIDSYINVDIDGYKDPKVIGFNIPDTADSFLHDVGALSPEIDVDSVSIEVKWSVDFEYRTWGIKGTYITINEISGIIKFNVVVPDPLNDEEYTEHQHEYEFNWDADDEDFWDNVKVETDGANWENGLSPIGCEIDLKTKKVNISFA